MQLIRGHGGGWQEGGRKWAGRGGSDFSSRGGEALVASGGRKGVLLIFLKESQNRHFSRKLKKCIKNM